MLVYPSYEVEGEKLSRIYRLAHSKSKLNYYVKLKILYKYYTLHLYFITE